MLMHNTLILVSRLEQRNKKESKVKPDKIIQWLDKVKSKVNWLWMVFLPIKLQLNYEKREYPELSKVRLEFGNFDKFFYIFSEFLLKNAKNQQKSLFFALLFIILLELFMYVDNIYKNSKNPWTILSF